MADAVLRSNILDIVPRNADLLPRLGKQLARRRTQYERPLADSITFPGWTNYASQWHIRNTAWDRERALLWLATWGGLLAWTPKTGHCLRYTSEHGLPGNVMNTVTVDKANVVWATSHDGLLCSLDPHETSWVSDNHHSGWTIRCLVPRPRRGIYVALRNANGRGAIGEIIAPGERLQVLKEGGLDVKECDVLLLDNNKVLWIGNPWGLFRYDNQSIRGINIDHKQVRALAIGMEHTLWIGTNWGIYRLRPGQTEADPPKPDWPIEMIVSLDTDPDTGDLWVITAREVGRIMDNEWRPVRIMPSGQSNVVTAPCLQAKDSKNSSVSGLPEGIVLVGGSNGLDEVSAIDCEAALSPAPEDHLSNGIQDLWVDETAVWAATAGGLFHFDGRNWRSKTADAPELKDIRTLLWDSQRKRLWIGSWRCGLRYIEQNVYIPEPIIKSPISALATSSDGTLWAAGISQIYWLPRHSSEWSLVPGAVPGSPPETLNIGVINTLCVQDIDPTGKTEKPTLWAGTSNGLFRYNPHDLIEWQDVTSFVPGNQERQSLQRQIHTLAIDPNTHYLWVGTVSGLYSQHNWQQQSKGHIRSIHFTSEGNMWVGMATGLEHWRAAAISYMSTGNPTQHFTSINSGLAANFITTLRSRRINNIEELWVGTPGGISHYQLES